MEVSKDRLWYLKELAGIDFGDARLDKRFFQVFHRLSDQPESSINKACGNWTESKGAYRLFSNEKIEPAVILDAHRESALERIKNSKVVLAIQDTTYFNFTNGGQIKGLGKISGRVQGDVMGLVAHSTFGMSLDGRPLGVLNQDVWARAETLKTVKGANRKLPIEDKESYKWLSALQDTHELTKQTDAKVVTIADRESDIFEFLWEAKKLESLFLIRASRNRVVKSDKGHLWEHMQSRPEQGYFEIEHDGQMRSLSLRFSEIEMPPSKRKYKASSLLGKCGPVVLRAIFVQEPNPPKGTPAIEWMLLTNLEVGSFEEAREKVRWYSLRWHIETWHKVLKSGCQVEKCKLSESDKVIRYITTLSIIAWRIYQLTHAARVDGGQSCEVLAKPEEWKALYCVTKKTKKPPKDPPSLEQFITWTAQLGGFMARKGDGKPGPKAIWQGLTRLAEYTAMYQILQT